MQNQLFNVTSKKTQKQQIQGLAIKRNKQNSECQHSALKNSKQNLPGIDSPMFCQLLNPYDNREAKQFLQNSFSLMDQSVISATFNFQEKKCDGQQRMSIQTKQSIAVQTQRNVCSRCQKMDDKFSSFAKIIKLGIKEVLLQISELKNQYARSIKEFSEIIKFYQKANSSVKEKYYEACENNLKLNIRLEEIISTQNHFNVKEHNRMGEQKMSKKSKNDKTMSVSTISTSPNFNSNKLLKSKILITDQEGKRQRKPSDFQKLQKIKSETLMIRKQIHPSQTVSNKDIIIHDGKKGESEHPQLRSLYESKIRVQSGLENLKKSTKEASKKEITYSINRAQYNNKIIESEKSQKDQCRSRKIQQTPQLFMKSRQLQEKIKKMNEGLQEVKRCREQSIL